jgi:hypothetical protein
MGNLGSGRHVRLTWCSWTITVTLWPKAVSRRSRIDSVSCANCDWQDLVQVSFIHRLSISRPRYERSTAVCTLGQTIRIHISIFSRSQELEASRFTILRERSSVRLDSSAVTPQPGKFSERLTRTQNTLPLPRIPRSFYQESERSRYCRSIRKENVLNTEASPSA